jgi:hypothetical protein
MDGSAWEWVCGWVCALPQCRRLSCYECNHWGLSRAPSPPLALSEERVRDPVPHFPGHRSGGCHKSLPHGESLSCRALHRCGAVLCWAVFQGLLPWVCVPTPRPVSTCVPLGTPLCGASEHPTRGVVPARRARDYFPRPHLHCAEAGGHRPQTTGAACPGAPGSPAARQHPPFSWGVWWRPGCAAAATPHGGFGALSPCMR